MSTYQIAPIGTPEDGRRTTAVARHVFGAGMALLLPRAPAWGFHAHDGEQTVGGVLFEKAGPGEGALAWIFVDPKAQGHRLGAHILERGIEAMDGQGLTTQFSLVRSDNTASWNLFAKNGYARPSVLKSLFGYSGAGFFKRLGYSLATGYSTWVRDAALDKTRTHPKRWAIQSPGCPDPFASTLRKGARPSASLWPWSLSTS